MTTTDLRDQIARAMYVEDHYADYDYAHYADRPADWADTAREKAARGWDTREGLSMWDGGMPAHYSAYRRRADSVLAVVRPLIAREKAEALRSEAKRFDREAAEGAAAVRVSGERCARCDLRYEERDEYPCVVGQMAHEYSPEDLDEARRVIVEPTWEGDRLRGRADQIEQEADRG